MIERSTGKLMMMKEPKKVVLVLLEKTRLVMPISTTVLYETLTGACKLAVKSNGNFIIYSGLLYQKYNFRIPKQPHDSIVDRVALHYYVCKVA